MGELLATVKREYIYESFKKLSAFRRVSVLELFPGHDTRLKFANEGKIYLNGFDLKEQEVNCSEEIEKIYTPVLINMEFFGVITGKKILNQNFVKDDFKFFVYAAFNHSINRWLSYEEIKDLCISTQKDVVLGHKIILEPFPLLECVDNNYDAIKNLLTNSSKEPYSLLIMPYPDDFVLRTGEKFLLEFPNPVFQEKIIKQGMFAGYVYREVDEFVSKTITDRYFKSILGKYVCFNSKGLLDLGMLDLKPFQTFVFDDIDRSDIFSSFVFESAISMAKDKIRLLLREKFIDFMVNYI